MDEPVWIQKIHFIKRKFNIQTGRREVPGSNPGRACRPSLSEFSVVISETHVYTG